jgi:hypothetical protein
MSNRARATSAAPIYFSSYHHFRTRKHYVDGAILRNNPVRITDEERRLIWKNGNNRADIVLSLGSGVQTNREGDKRKSTKQSKTKYVLRMVPKGLKKKITTSYHMVTSTLDCEREWHEFVASVRDDKSFVRVCHRLNVGLEEKPPKLDDIEMMGTLQYETDYYFSGTAIKRYINREYKTGREHIQAVASRLVASLFYFEEVSLHPQAPLNQKKLRAVSGLLRCRLSRNMEKQFAFLVASKPEFRICERGSTPREISCLGFDMKAFCSTIEFLVSGDAWIIEVSYAHMNWNWEAISGFS